MNKLLTFLAVCFILGTSTIRATEARKLIVGVVPPAVQTISEKQQDALIDQLVKAGVNTVRFGISDKHPIQGFNQFVIKAYKRGIGTIFILGPTEGGSLEHVRAAEPELHLWPQPALSDADPDGFRKWFAPKLEEFEKAGVRFTGFELGNEINNSQYNGDFIHPLASARILGIDDLKNKKDAEGQKLAASFRSYLKIMATLKDIRDHSKVNHTTPIISAGLVGGEPGPRPGLKLDGVSGIDTLMFLKENGLDDLVDGYGIHVYPSKDPNKTAQDRIDELNKEFLKVCTHGSKPCWVTEWGFANKDQNCPLKDDLRAKLISVMRDAFQQLAAKGQIANITCFSWGDAKWGIYRCGELTEAGKLALSPP
jgi:hypothetical protein